MASPGMWRSPTRLYLDRTKTRIVPENSREAAFVLVGESGEITMDEARRYGLLDVTPAETPVMLDPNADPTIPHETAAAAEGVTMEDGPKVDPGDIGPNTPADLKQLDPKPNKVRGKGEDK